MIRLLPWKFLVKHAARRYGVIDPATWLARIRSFAQPSEVAEPLELLRAGIVFHARGLVNTKAIQHNLDWIWPYWVERQFDPADRSFIPRAFSFSHINLTHRNWTAVGEPDTALYPIVDPRGLVTPLHDGWSIDFWLITGSRHRLLPSKLKDDAVRQSLQLDPTLGVRTSFRHEGMELDLATWMEDGPDGPNVITEARALSEEDGWLVVAVRPYNPEGIQFVDRISLNETRTSFLINDLDSVSFGEPPDSLRMARYAEGDVYLDLPGDGERESIECEVGMATAAALFRIDAERQRILQVSTNLTRKSKSSEGAIPLESRWHDALQGTALLHIPDERLKFLYDSAVRTLILLSADELVPGPYTYRRFWFRDACLMLHPLMAIGRIDRAERILSTFPSRQTHAGYFLSQDGEWDSNGQVLWIFARYAELSGRSLTLEMDRSARKGVRWLEKKRVSTKGTLRGIKGLLPAGFSAEHLGPNDYYYWDDFWAQAGLQAMACYWKARGDHEAAEEAEVLGDQYARAIEASLESIPRSRAKGALPAAPGRRMDAGAVGSLVADYPLQLFPPGESRIMKTATFLMERCFHHGCFLQEMIHSGINAYLTLDIAQTLLRAGDIRFAELIRRVASLASPTGQWPEAIHPQTLGGCMGDGQHGWAAGEWIMMLRNCFIREECNHLVIGSGILPEWMGQGHEIGFGPARTRWGEITVLVTEDRIAIEAIWHGDAPPARIEVPGYLPLATILHSGAVYRLEAS